MITRTRLTNVSHEQAALKAGLFATQGPLFDNVQVGGASMTFERNAEIYGEGESADYVYKVLSGSVRAYKVLSDGRRQVTAFYLPGDVFGIDSGSEHSNSAEAIDKATILVVKRSSENQRSGKNHCSAPVRDSRSVPFGVRTSTSRAR